MSHEMTEVDAMASGRKLTVWHQSETDTIIKDGLMDVDVALAAGFKRRDMQPGHWEPTIVPARIAIDGDNSMIVPSHNFVVRDDLATDDPRRILGHVGDRYTLISNADIVDFCDSWSRAGDARIDTIGSLRGGAVVYVSAVLATEAQIAGDRIAHWVLVTSTHDGKASWQAMIVPLRVVCNNTLTAAMGAASNVIKIRHTASAADRMSSVSEVWEGANVYLNKWTDAMQSLTTKRLSRADAEALLTATVIKGGPTTSKVKDAMSKADKDRGAILDLFGGQQIGFDDSTAKDSAWMLVNAWAQWAEQGYTIRKHDQSRSDDEVRADTMLFGAGARDRQALINGALAM